MFYTAFYKLWLKLKYFKIKIIQQYEEKNESGKIIDKRTLEVAVRV